MKYCPKCREQYPDNSVFCGNDGSPLKSSENASSENASVEEFPARGCCKACGEKVEPDTLFCPKCGAKVYTQKSLDSFHRSEQEEEHRFTMGTDESLDRTAEVERPQYAGTNRSEDLHSSKKGRKGLYVAGGAILAIGLLAIFALPRLMDGWRLSGPSGVPSSPSPSQSSAPPPSPSLPEPSPAPNSQGGAAIAPPSSEQTGQTAAIPPIENPAPAVSNEPTPPSKPTKRSSKRSVPGEAELAARRETGSPFYPEPTKTPESQVELGRKEGIPTEAKAGASQETASLKETPVPRRSADPGTYETIRVAMARQGPSDSAEIVDQIKPRTRLTVMGSEGDWLVVRSVTRNRTVYVRRDDAMFVSEKISTAPSSRELEIKWRDLERQIQQAISNQGITGVSVSFIRDTAYLRGTVHDENQRFIAEQSARSFPEVLYVYNGIWIGR